MAGQTQTMNTQQILQLMASGFFCREFVQQNGDALRQALPPNNQALIAAMPKTGSTLLVRTMAAVTGRAHNLCTYAGDGNEEELYFPAVARDTLLRKTICKLHVRATTPNLEILRAFHITPIVQVRNLFDIAVSMRDHIMKGFADSPYPQPLLRRLAELGEQAQYDYVIETWLPWCVQFYRTWIEAERTHDWLTLHWVDYDELNADAVSVIGKCLRFLGLEARPETIREAIEALPASQTRKNQAVSGRGERELTDAQKQRIVTLTQYYDWIDWSPLGIAAEMIAAP